MNSASWAAACAALLLASAGIAGGVAGAEAPAALLGVTRLLVGGAALALLPGPRAVAQALRVMPFAPLAAAALALALFQWSYFEAVAASGAGVAALASAGSSPIAADAIECALGARRPGVGSIAAALLMAVALWLLSRTTPAGALALAALSGCAYAVYVAATRHLERQHAGDGFASTAIALLLASFVLLPPAFGSLHTLLEARMALVAAYLGFVATALPYALVVVALRRLAATRALLILLAQPLAALVASAWLLGEPLSAAVLGAAVAIACSIAVRTLPGVPSFRSSTC